MTQEGVLTVLFHEIAAITLHPHNVITRANEWQAEHGTREATGVGKPNAIQPAKEWRQNHHSPQIFGDRHGFVKLRNLVLHQSHVLQNYVFTLFQRLERAIRRRVSALCKLLQVDVGEHARRVREELLIEIRRIIAISEPLIRLSHAIPLTWGTIVLESRVHSVRVHVDEFRKALRKVRVPVVEQRHGKRAHLYFTLVRRADAGPIR